MKIKASLFALALTVTFATAPAFANDCEAEIIKMNKEFVSTNSFHLFFTEI